MYNFNNYKVYKLQYVLQSYLRLRLIFSNFFLNCRIYTQFISLCNIRMLSNPDIMEVLRKYFTKDARRSLFSDKAPHLSCRYLRCPYHRGREVLHYYSVCRKERISRQSHAIFQVTCLSDLALSKYMRIHFRVLDGHVLKT